MSLVEAVVLGLVQGLTEFVPISSSGHLVIVPELLGWRQPGLTFDVLLHTASLAALLAYFRRELVALARGLMQERSQQRLFALLVVGTIPAVVAGGLFGDYFEGTFEDARSAALQLIATAVILVAGELMLARHLRRRDSLRAVDDLSWADAGAIGVAQAVAIFPGISRSGSTIATGLSLAIGRDDAARFSFLLAIPALLGATLVEVPELAGEPISLGSAAAGFAASLISSYAAIAGLIRYLRARSLYPFAAYCLIAGGVFYFVLP